MTHTLIHIQSYIFIISQPKVSFQFLTFKEGSYVVLTSTYHYFLSSLTFWDCKWDPLPLKLWNESYNKCHNANDKPQVTMHVQMKCNNTWKSHIYNAFSLSCFDENRAAWDAKSQHHSSLPDGEGDEEGDWEAEVVQQPRDSHQTEAVESDEAA